MARPVTLFTGRWAALAAVFLALAAAPAFGQTNLAYKFKKGDKLNYTLATTTKGTAGMPGREIKSTTIQEMELTWIVKGAADGKADVVQRIDQVHQKQEMPGSSFEFDSKTGKKPDGQFGKQIALLEAMVGAEISRKIDPQGETTETKLSDKLMEFIEANSAFWGGSFLEDTMKDMLPSMLVLPKESIAKGKNWNKKTKLKTPFGVMKLDTTFTYAGPQTRNNMMLERIDSKSAVELEPVPGTGLPGLTMKIKSSDIKGLIYFDNKAGRLVESTLVQKMVMESTLMGKKIDSTQEQTTTLKLAK